MVDYLVEIGIDKTKNLKGDVSIIRALNEDGKVKWQNIFYLLDLKMKVAKKKMLL